MRKSSGLTFGLVILTFVLAPHTSSSAQSNQSTDINALIQKLIGADSVERDAIVDQLDRIADPSLLVPPVLAALDDVDPREASKLLDVLARFPKAVEPAPLLRLARRAGIGIPRLEPQLQGQLLNAGPSAHEEIFKSITAACSDWIPSDEDLSSETEESVSESQNQGKNLQAFLDWAAKVLAGADSQGVGDVLKMLRGTNACLRRAAQGGLSGYALENEKPQLERVMHSLAGGLSDPDPAVQKAAVATVEPIVGFSRAPLSHEMVAPLFAILKNAPDAQTRYKAFILLRSGPGKTPLKAAHLASQDADEGLQNAASEFLEHITDPSKP